MLILIPIFTRKRRRSENYIEEGVKFVFMTKIKHNFLQVNQVNAWSTLAMALIFHGVLSMKY